MKFISVLLVVFVLFGIGYAVATFLPVIKKESSINTITINTTNSNSSNSVDSISIDITKLPLGDGKVSTTKAEKGYVYECKVQESGGGSTINGPWIHGNTWNMKEKLKVSGNKTWSNATITISHDNDVRTISANGLPKDAKTGIFPIQKTDSVYKYDKNPNNIKEQTVHYLLPKNPNLQPTPSCVGGGPIGIALNGVAIFNALDGENRDAVAHEAQDNCDGHPEKDGTYHYHNISNCLADKKAGHSDLVGYALDGFGIYGIQGEDGKELTNEDLDECHGHIHEIVWDGTKKVMYHYHATHEYPYTIGCFRGKPQRVEPSQNTMFGNLPSIKPPLPPRINF